SYWMAGGLNSSWEFGTPDAGNPVINAAASGINAWMTNLDGNYNNDENSYLLSPCFDFTTLADPSIDFSLWYNTDANTDGMQLQSSVDNGATWQTVGVLPPPPNNDNWYNNTVSALGMVGWTDNSGAWVTAHYSLDYLSQEPSVRLKFVFASDPDNLGGNPPTVQDYDGVAIDDIVIADPQAANDIRVMEWLNPQSAYYMTAAELVSFRVKNLGTNPITSFNAWYSIDGGATYTTPETFTVSLATNDYANLDFSQLADFATPGTYPCEVVVEIPSDENALNNVITLDVVSYPSITSFPYYEDFQTDDHFWEAGGTYSSWEFGIPVGTTIPGDPEVNPFLDSAWVTNLDGVYNNNEFSWVESPLMDFSSLIMPAITMRIAYDAEGFTSDGANLQYSLAGGTWTTVGTLGVSGNWYINFVDGLGGEPGWTDFSNGWILATHDLPLVLAGQTDVKFRILFGSDGNTVMEGMAFDDVTIFENAPHDLAVTEWLTQGIACGLGDQEIITVKIKNLGYFAESNFDIAYSIVFNGVVVTVNETVSATILQNDSLEYSFVTPADMSAPGVYTCTVEILTTDDEPANNLIGKSLLSSPLVATFPYFESFEGSDGNWVSGGTNSSWELGAPNAGNPFITTAGLGVESWVTNLNGDYNTLENSWVESPCFDFTNVEYPAIQFQYISDCEFFSSTFGFDGSILEYSTDGGYNWTRVGAYGDTANWYNVLQVWGFNNTEAWGAQSAGWVTTGIDMFFLNYEPNVKFRFRFASDSYNYPAGSHYDGFGFDDITVYNNAPFPMDVGISAITATLDGCENQTGYPVTVMIKNYRTDSTLYAGEVIPVSFTYNGGATVLEYFTLPSDLLILQEIAYTFAATIDMPSLGTYPIEATTVLMNDL
ncbi:MAG: hypothetical protein U9R19_11140, partial [Bacteroidota bacterium]|nr:hypothetical protein [Bacteroidota bacterium]